MQQGRSTTSGPRTARRSPFPSGLPSASLGCWMPSRNWRGHGRPQRRAPLTPSVKPDILRPMDDITVSGDRSIEQMAHQIKWVQERVAPFEDAIFYEPGTVARIGNPATGYVDVDCDGELRLEHVATGERIKTARQAREAFPDG